MALNQNAAFRYLNEVLGIENVTVPETEPSKVAADSATIPRVLVFSSLLGGPEYELLYKMLSAMKLSPNDVELMNVQMSHEQVMARLQDLKPSLFLVFGEEASRLLNFNLDENRGRFIDINGVATVFTYGPKELFINPTLKVQAWNDLKVAMRRLR
jgi:hypothetical protein